MNAGVKKEIFVVSPEERMKKLERLYANFPRDLRSKVRLQDDRFCFTVEGVGAEVAQVRPDTTFLGCKINSEARAMLYQPGYDQSHVLVPGRDYQMVLYYGNEFALEADRTKANICNLARAEYGNRVDDSPPAELAFLVRTKFTFAEMQMLGLEYIAVLHARIAGVVQSNQLLSKASKGDPWMKGWITGPYAAWAWGGGFAFPLVD